MLFVNLLLLVNCATVDIPDIKPRIVLPASGDCYSISTITHKEYRIPKALCAEQNKRGIILMSDDWAKLKYTLLKNCLTNQCKQTVGALDGLFYAVDNALKKVK